MNNPDLFLFSQKSGVRVPSLRAIKLYPELCIAALKARKDKELALWYELRALNATGSGRLVLNEAVDGLIYSMGYSTRTLQRLLKVGDGLLWQIHRRKRSTIEIYGLKRVTEYLGASHVSAPREIPPAWFVGRSVKRAWLFASFFQPDGSKRGAPISRASICAATGVQKRQQIRYHGLVKIRRTANFAVEDSPLAGESKRRSLVPMLSMVEGKTKQWVVIRQLGNSYCSRAVLAHRGMVKKVNALLGSGLCKGMRHDFQRRFFTGAKSLIRCAQRHPEPFLWVSPQERMVKGRVEWALAIPSISA